MKSDGGVCMLADYNNGYCEADTSVQITKIEFRHDFGDVPPLKIVYADNHHPEADVACVDAADSLPINTCVDKNFSKEWQSGDEELVHAEMGSKEEAVCSNRGTCDEASGICSCYYPFYSSDGDGARNPKLAFPDTNKTLPGPRGECGYKDQIAPVFTCPGEVSCMGHGVCDFGNTYSCTCATGWTGAACDLRLCAKGKAWFGPPADDNVAHAEMECSNMGLCERDSGKCTCHEQFEGDSCGTMKCPVTSDLATLGMCSGHGDCVFMGEAALLGVTALGSATPYTYGTIPMNPATWDFDQIKTCHCEEGWGGIDCNDRLCARTDDQTTPGLPEQQVFVCSMSFGEPANGLTGQYASGRQPVCTSSVSQYDTDHNGDPETANPHFCQGPPVGCCAENTHPELSGTDSSTGAADYGRFRRSKAGVCYNTVPNKTMSTIAASTVYTALQDAVDFCNSNQGCGGIVRQRKGTDSSNLVARNSYGEWTWEFMVFNTGGSLGESMPMDCQPECANPTLNDERAFKTRPFTTTYLKVPCHFAFRFRCPHDDEELCIRDGYQTPYYTAASRVPEIEADINALTPLLKQNNFKNVELLNSTNLFWDDSICGGRDINSHNEFRFTFTQTYGDLPMIQMITPSGLEGMTTTPLCVNDCICSSDGFPPDKQRIDSSCNTNTCIATGCIKDAQPMGCVTEVCEDGDPFKFPCVFPFRFNGQEYTACTTIDNLKGFNGEMKPAKDLGWCMTGGGSDVMAQADTGKTWAHCECVDCGFTQYGRETQKGTLEDAECGNHGICDYVTGTCGCYEGWAASNGFYGQGTVDDCGYRYPFQKGADES